MKTAFETTDETFIEDSQIFQVNELGLPKKEIKIDLEEKDISLFWVMHEKETIIVLGLCSLFFLSIIFYGSF